jgi:hypothetical protein
MNSTIAVPQRNSIELIKRALSVSNIRSVCDGKTPIVPSASMFKSIGFNMEGTLRRAFEYALQWMQKKYPCEMVYKNAICRKLLVNKHMLGTASMLNEFPVGGSRADCIITNGESQVYEIKSKFDSPERLEKQLLDYSKAFRFINIVVSNELEDYYSTLVKKIMPSVGIRVLKQRGSLPSARKPAEYTSNLDIETMFMSLRKNEHMHIYEKISGKKPDFSDAEMYSECLQQAKAVSAVEFSVFFEEQLKQRKVMNADFLSTNKESLLPILSRLVLIDPSQKQISRAKEWLESEVR